MLICYPMGGTGQRFVEAGYAVAKPLLEIQGKSLLQWALTSTRPLGGSYHYLPRVEVALEMTLDAAVMATLPKGCWHTVMHQTPGPLQTMLEAEGCLSVEEELLICDCDSLLEATELQGALEVFRASQADGGVTIRRTQDPMCSYAAVDAEWWVSQTREKDPFTCWSTTGPYWFKSARTFLVAARKAAAAHHVSIAPVYNYLPGRTKAVPVASFQHLGTPVEFEQAKQLMERIMS